MLYINLVNYVVLLCRIIYISFYLIRKKNKIDKTSVLYSSIKFHYYDVTNLILYLGANPEAQHPSLVVKTTPLIYSVDYNNDIAAKLLLSYGANVNRYAEEAKITPLYLSVLYSNLKCLNILLSYYPDINYQVNDMTVIELSLMICNNFMSTVIKGNELSSFYKHRNRYLINVDILKSLVSHFILYEKHYVNKNAGYYKNKHLIIQSVILKQFRDLCNDDIMMMKSITVKNYSNDMLSFFDILVNNDLISLLNNLDNIPITDLSKKLKVYNNKVKLFTESVTEMV
ncbi:ankyrin repeat protein [Canarypox virus]|uniref:CNPV293 ankyrin repeat protein n=1 Tax=Canarypox virus TaxID=44088 RepID=Q6VZ54_CNPV|nr:ankyrin repeat protein [Canarypox virus]AAR83639.1 CNPV293 ankyrin repeat protein [Canarypox virus]AWD84769.1 ankyrin repeat protein [Canarypox virus]